MNIRSKSGYYCEEGRDLRSDRFYHDELKDYPRYGQDDRTLESRGRDRVVRSDLKKAVL